MNRDSDTALRSRVGVGRFKATHHVEVKDDVQPADAKRYKGRETEMTQTTKANGLFTAFKVFEPSSRSKRTFSVTLHPKKIDKMLRDNFQNSLKRLPLKDIFSRQQYCLWTLESKID